MMLDVSERQSFGGEINLKLMSHPVITQQGAEVGCLLLVDQLDEAGTVHGIDGREDAAGE